MKRGFLLFFLSLQSFASVCSSVNLITEADSPFQKIPVYNQGRVNICYAYSAAQILDWHQMKNGASKRSIHPAWAAFQYSLKKNRNKLEIGHPKEAIESLSSALNCDFNLVEAAIRNLDLKNSTVESLQKVFEHYCPKDILTQIRIPKIERLNYRRLNSDESSGIFLSSQLETSPSPLSIAYCANVWKNSEFKGIGFDSSGNRTTVDSKCDYHESIVVGQKMVNQSCHFLVRNTWGDKWGPHNKKYNCVCKDKETGQFIDDCRTDTHGSPRYKVQACWINGEVLSRNIGQITTLVR